MGELRQLRSEDVVFVGGETATIHQHTAGLTLLDARERPGFGFEALRGHLEERLADVPHFRWRLHEVPLGLDLPYWVEDEDFRFDHHLRRIAVPAPGDREALAELVAYLYSRHLDRRRPLWEAWFIEGLADGQYGLFTKLHHSMMDGEGAAQLGAMMCDLEPDAEPQPVDPAIAEARPGAVPAPWQSSLNAARHLAALPVRAGREAVDGLWRAASHRLSPGEGPTERRPVPVASFNCEIGRDRTFVYGSVSLSAVKAVKEHFDVTVNDVVLALVAESLRRYLLGRGELPDSPLRTSIAVSLRTEGDGSDGFSNQITTATVTLATDVEDPVERLRAIAASSQQAKRDARAGAKGFLEIMGILPPGLVGVTMAMAPPSLVPRTTGFNLLISNVRGSPLPLYIGGARTTGMYPMSIIAPGNGINVTAISYLDDIDVGCTLEPSAFPDPWPLVDGLGEALDGYVGRLPAKARRKVAGRR